MSEGPILASASARRRALLDTMGLSFEVRPSDVEEAPRAGESAEAMVCRLAESKARAVGRAAPGRFVLAADTTVVVDGAILEKPHDEEDARTMLTRLSGRWHEVWSGVSLARGEGVLETLAVRTRVHFLRLTDERIARYVATGEPMDKAGAYGIQGLAAAFVDRIDGSYSSVVGLPVAETIALLERYGALEEWP